MDLAKFLAKTGFYKIGLSEKRLRSLANMWPDKERWSGSECKLPQGLGSSCPRHIHRSVLVSYFDPEISAALEVDAYPV